MKSALFLDRDGVINQDLGYVYKQQEFIFMDGIFELVRFANQNLMPVIIVTNQAGIGRGYYSVNDFEKITDWMKQQFLLQDAKIDAVYYCPDHPTEGIGEYRRDSFDRKPNPGMFLKAAVDHQINLTQSIMIGDKDTDMLAARRAGIEHLFLIGNINSNNIDFEMSGITLFQAIEYVQKIIHKV